ncbi:MAG: lipoate--protein ligase [Kiritimatiellaeota bacterium]|nr:lipoate--protein ligase [Kiritimatiellota bacterium]
MESRGHDAHRNQAVEAALFDTVGEDEFVLYLWANDNAVFIGRHQNAYLECDIPRLEADGGKLARRFTGGGAVYHDIGNVNYSFIAPLKFYDEQRQFGFVIDALQGLGINALKTGRNDMTVEGRKFSGNAFFRNATSGLHHGTILIKSDYAKIGKYLTASKVKLQSKNIASVPQRIINLSEINPRITKADVFDSLVKTVQKELGVTPVEITEDDLDQGVLRERLAFCTDKSRIYGTDTYYDARLEHRFDWGTADIRLKLERNKIVKAVIYSDALDTALATLKEAALVGADINDVMNVLT